MSMMALVNDLASQGRNGDTLLAHITTEEAQLLKDNGGSGTINPETGIMEFGFFSDLWDGFKSIVRTIAPVIIPAVAIFVPTLIPAIGTALGASAASAGIIGAAALSAGVTLASGGNLKQILTSAALAGASTYLTPIVGKALTFDGASQLSQIMAGSAAVGAGYTAMRGGTVQQMMAAAATGAASAYLGNLAKDSVAKMNNLMASGKVSGTITEKGATDATFLAADAANLKAAGLTQTEISKALQATGANPMAADYAAASVIKGMDTSTIAANLGANSTTQQIYSGAANTKAIIAGNNAEMVQRIEDAKLVAQDAAQLRQQGLSQNDIKQNLIASGVNETTANLASQRAFAGSSADTISSEIINQSSYLGSGKVYTNTTDTIARDLGQAMTSEQIKEFKALPFKDLVNSGQLTIDEASVLGQHNLTTQQVTDLTKLGYTANDLDNLISSGVTPQTLTNLANTKFPESQINDMLQNGVSANDISNASIQVSAGKLSTDVAEKLLNGGLTGQEVAGLASNNKANSVANLIDKGLTEDNFRKMYSSGTDFTKVENGLNSGKLNIDTLNQQVSTNNNYNKYINDTLAVTPQQPTQQPTQPVAPVQPTSVTAQIENTGLVDSVDAQVLADSGYTANDVKNLVNLGYTGSELAEMASTGVTASTLTTLASTPFTESTINDLLTTGHSANEISKASFAVSNKGVPIDTATQLMNKGVSGQDIYNMSFGKAGSIDQALQLANQGITPENINKLYQNGWDLGKISAGLSDGHLNSESLNNTIATSKTYGTDITKQLAAPLPVKPETPPPTQPSNTVPVTLPDGSTGNYDVTTGTVTDSQGTVVSETTMPEVGPGTDVAALSPGNQQIVNDVGNQYNQGTISWEDASAKINQAVQNDIDSGYLKSNGDGTYTAPDGVVYFMNNETGMWDSRVGVEGGQGVGPGTVSNVPSNTPTVPSTVEPVTPEIPSTTAPVTPETPTVPTTPSLTYTNQINANGTTYNVDHYTDGTIKYTDTQNGGVGNTADEATVNGQLTTPSQGTGTTSGTGLGPLPITGPVTPTTPTTPTTPVTNVPEIVVTAPKEPTVPTLPPLTPPVQEVIPPTPKIPEVVVPETVTPETPTTETPTDTTPYVPILTPEEPILPSVDDYRGKYTLGTPIRPNIPNTLNPGWITNVPTYYQTTNDAQSKYYWGGHPYQTGTTFNPTLYNTLPNAPSTPFGLGFAQKAATAHDIMGAMQSRYSSPIQPIQPTINTL